MSAPSPRGVRTPGIIIGRLSNPKRGPKHERMARVAASYCTRVEIAVLAAIAEELSESGEGETEATIAYEAARAAYTPRPDMPPLANDMAGEAELGRKLVARVVEATRRYADHARIERKAPSIAATQKWVENFGKAAAGFVAAWESPLDPLARVIARADIGRHLPPGTELREIVEAARRIAWAAEDVARALDDEAGCKDGMAWDRWVCDLTKVCHENGLPCAVTHDPEVRSDDQESEFVSLVAAIMHELPRSLRRHDASYGSLAHSISVARRNADKRRKAREHEIHSVE